MYIHPSVSCYIPAASFLKRNISAFVAVPTATCLSLLPTPEHHCVVLIAPKKFSLYPRLATDYYPTHETAPPLPALAARLGLMTIDKRPEGVR